MKKYILVGGGQLRSAANIREKGEKKQRIAAKRTLLHLFLAPQIVGAARSKTVNKSNRRRTKMNEPIPYTVAEFAGVFCMSVEAAAEEISKGKIQADTSGNYRCIPFSELRRYLQVRFMENLNARMPPINVENFANATGATKEEVLGDILEGHLKAEKAGENYLVPFSEYIEFHQDAIEMIIRAEKMARRILGNGAKYELLEERGLDENGFVTYIKKLRPIASD